MVAADGLYIVVKSAGHEVAGTKSNLALPLIMVLGKLSQAQLSHL